MKPQDVRDYALGEYSLARSEDYAAELSRIPMKLGGARILDLAAGPGTWTKLFAEAAAGRVVWTDRSQQFLALARDYLRGHPHEERVFFAISDLTAIPFRDEVFDIVYCRLALHHSSDEALTLSEIARVLRKGGLGVLIVQRRGLVRERVPLGLKKPLHYLSPYVALVSGKKLLPTLYHLERLLLERIRRVGLGVELCDTSNPTSLYIAARKPLVGVRPTGG